MAVLWNEEYITTDMPPVVSTCEVTSQSRNGSTQAYNISISMHTTRTGGWYNNRWACKVTVGGVVFAANLTIKPTTSGVIGTTVYTGTCSGSINVSGNTGEAYVSVEYWDTGFSGNLTGQHLKTLGANVSYTVLPEVSLGLNSYNNNSAVLNYTYKNVAPEKVDIYNGNTYLKTVTSTPFTITGLAGNTNYNFIGYGYANGGWGTSGSTVSITTYPNPVYPTNINISNITPFQATISVSSSSTNDTDLIEYTLLNSTGGVVNTYNLTSYTLNLSSLSEETTYRVRVRMRTKTSGVWSDYIYSSNFTTTSDQASSYTKVNGVYVKGKTYCKVNDVYVVAKKIYKKENGVWIQGINT